MSLRSIIGRPVGVLGAWFAVCLSAWSVAWAIDEPAREYLRGLRERRLFSVAESYCLRELDDPELPAADRVELTVELSRTLADHAAWRTGQEQEELWSRAAAIVEEQLQRDANSPRREMLLLQSAVVPAEQAELLAWQTRIAPYDAELQSQAISALQSAARGLGEAEATLSERQRTARMPSAAERAAGALTPADVRLLSQEARLRMASLSVELGRLLPSGIERTAALHAAESRLGPLLRESLPDDFEWEARLLRTQTSRLRGELDQAQSLADAILRDDPPPPVRTRGLAELVRIELARERPDQALERLLAEQEQQRWLSEELRSLNVEALLAARDAAVARSDQPLADDLLAEAERIASQLGGPWGARSQALLTVGREAAQFGTEAALELQAGRAAYQHGDHTAAAEHYAAAIKSVREAGRHQAVPELLYTRASILLEAGEFQQAAADFSAAADDAHAGDRAAQAHLLYAYCLGRLWEERPTQSRREAYAAALETHRQRFTAAPTFVDATWMLAAFEEARQQWTRALELYVVIPTDHARGPAARARVAALYEQILQRLREIGQPPDQWEDLAVAQLTEYLDTMPLPPARLSPLDADVALRLARILLNHRTPDYGSADALLDRVIGSSQAAVREAETNGQTPDPTWPALQHVATQLRIVSLAGQDRLNDALSILDSLPQSDPKVLLGVLNGLSEMSAGIRPERERALGELQLKAAEALDAHRDQLEPPDARLLDHCLAQAYSAVGRPNDAIAVYESLLEGSPRDKRLLRTAAELLTDSGQEQAWETAKTYWRRLEALEQPGSKAWLSARLQVAATCLKLGQTEECRKLLSVTRVLYPELGGPELKAEFDALQAEVDGTSTQRR